MTSNKIAWLLFLLSVASLASAQLLIKAVFVRLFPLSMPMGWMSSFAAILSVPAFWLCGFLIILSAGCWYVALTRLPLSAMMPLAAIVSPVVSIGAALWLGESMSLSKLAAILWICVGVAWLGSQQT